MIALPALIAVQGFSECFYERRCDGVYDSDFAARRYDAPRPNWAVTSKFMISVEFLSDFGMLYSLYLFISLYHVYICLYHV